MFRLGDLWFRLKAIFTARRMERELDEEFEFHLAMEAEKLMSQGWSAEAAAAEARRRFDGVTRPRQMARDSWGIGWVRDLATDIRHAFRQFRRRPGYSALGIGTLALGLGATVGLFGVIRSMLLRPLPVADEASLRVFWMDYSWMGAEFDFLKERLRAFSKLAAYSSDGTTLRVEADNSVLAVGIVSAELFDVIGAQPMLGRTFRPGEDRPGAAPVVVLGYGLWQRAFGGDRGIIGRTITLDSRPTTVIGVMPRGFYFPTPEHALWRPLDLDPASIAYQGNGWLTLIGRLKPGTGPALESEEVARLTKALGERFTYPQAWDKTKGASLRPLRDYLVGDVRPALLLLFGAGSLLLLIACANVAALVLARTTDRAQEITVRAALGAGRARLARQIVAESLCFSTAAGAVGCLIATLGFRTIVSRLPLQHGLADAARLDWTVFGAALMLSAVVGLLVAAAPIRHLLRGELGGVSGSRSAAGLRGTGTIHGLLVTTEAAVAVVLVVGALLLIRSVSGLLALDLGFEPKGLVAIDVVDSDVQQNGAERSQIFDAILERVAALPGVVSAGYVGRLPIRDGGWQGPVSVVGRSDLEGPSAPNSLYRQVSPGYFKTMGIRLLAGRGIEPGDRAGGMRVGVVSAAFAARAWPGENPVGRQLLRTGGGRDTLAITVVGVASEVRSLAATGANPFVLYVPEAQGSSAFAKPLVLRITGSAVPIIAAVERLVTETDARFATARPTTLDDVVTASMTEPIQLRFFLTIFAGLALVLGVSGTYSVVSYSVARRQTELGLRMALGATPRQVLQQVIVSGVGPIVVGTGIGLVTAILAAGAATRFLYGVSPADPASIVTAAGVLLAAGVAAAAIPAVRASRVDPVASLRAE